jgi:non-heme chloroperoxidase
MGKSNHGKGQASLGPNELIPVCAASSVSAGKYDEAMFQKNAVGQYAQSSRLNYAKPSLPELSGAAEGVHQPEHHGVRPITRTSRT